MVLKSIQFAHGCPGRDIPFLTWVFVTWVWVTLFLSLDRRYFIRDLGRGIVSSGGSLPSITEGYLPCGHHTGLEHISQWLAAK
jgi:hypothetical protein